MNKRGEANRLLLEIAYISFAVFIGLAVLLFVNSITKDSDFKANIYSKDLSLVIISMQNSPAKKLIVTYELPAEFEFNLDENYIYVKHSSQKSPIKEKYPKKDYSVKFERKENLLILEKDETVQA